MSVGDESAGDEPQDPLSEPDEAEAQQTAADDPLSPSEIFRRRCMAVARRCARRPPKTLSGQQQKSAPRRPIRRRSFGSLDR